MSKSEFHATIPVLPCRDLQVVIDFYTQKPGFNLVWLDDEGQDYAALARENAAIHLALAAEGEHQPSLQNKSTCEPAARNIYASVACLARVTNAC